MTLKSDITRDVKRRYDHQGSDDLDNALSLASVDIVKLPDSMDANYDRDRIQKALGPLSTFVNSKSVAQLRRENRKSRYMHPSIQNAHLPSSRVLISPPHIKNNRFYNNNLLTPVKSPHELAIILQPSSTPEISSEVKIMKKQVIRRLISKGSPPSDIKKKCFCALMNDDESAVEILNLAVESGNSVEDTKDMIMNYL